jgi:hypothetical protein
MDLKYQIQDEFTLRVCSNNCTEMTLNRSNLNLQEFLSIDPASGHLLTNNTLDLALFQQFFDTKFTQLTLQTSVLASRDGKSLFNHDSIDLGFDWLLILISTLIFSPLLAKIKKIVGLNTGLFF